jgi:hypothetical protein
VNHPSFFLCGLTWCYNSNHTSAIHLRSCFCISFRSNCLNKFSITALPTSWCVIIRPKKRIESLTLCPPFKELDGVLEFCFKIVGINGWAESNFFEFNRMLILLDFSKLSLLIKTIFGIIHQFCNHGLGIRRNHDNVNSLCAPKARASFLEMTPTF